MKMFLTITFFTLTTNLFSQELKEIEPKVGQTLDFGVQVQEDWKKIDQLNEALFTGTKKWKDLSKEEVGLYTKYGETSESMWDVGDGGCSWYCGAGNYSVSTSSDLPLSEKWNYKSINLSDFSYETAWVEGVKNNGIGETIEFSFTPTHPRITEVIITNGYVRTYTAWKNNSRVKTLKMYANNKPIAILKLKDVYADQYFKLDTIIGHSDRENYEKLKEKENWIVKFEILEVYQGDKYDDTAITEIYFDGIDVH